MVDPVAAYLESLRGRISKRLPPQSVSDHVREIETHLRMNVADRIAPGELESNAQIDALMDLGPDRLVADGLIRAHSGIGKLSVWRVSWLPILLLAASLAVPISFEYVQPPVISDFWLKLASWLPTIFMASLVYASWRSRKVLAVPMLAAMAVLILAISADALNLDARLRNTTPVEKRQQSLQEREQMVQTDEAELLLARDSDGKAPFPQALLASGHYLGPVIRHELQGESGPIIPLERQVVVWHIDTKEMDSEAAARQAWLAVDRRALTGVELDAEEASRSLAIETASDSRQKAFLILGSVWMLARNPLWFILALNLIAVGLERLYREVLKARWRPKVVG